MGEPKSWALASVEGKEGQFDNITKPKHYQGKYGSEAIEVIKSFLTEEELRGYYKGNALKYLLRERSKNGLEDLKKLDRYLDWLIEETEKANERR